MVPYLRMEPNNFSDSWKGFISLYKARKNNMCE